MNRFAQYLLCTASVLITISLFLANGVRGEEKGQSKKVTPRPAVQSVDSGSYRQQVRTSYAAESGLPMGPVHNLAFDQKLFASTDKGIATFDNGRWQLVYASTSPVTTLTAARNKVWFIQDNRVFELLDSSKPNPIASAPLTVNLTSLMATEKSLYVGTNAGLFVVNAGAIVPVNHPGRTRN